VVLNIAAAGPASSYALLPHRNTIPVNFEEPLCDLWSLGLRRAYLQGFYALDVGLGFATDAL